MTDVRGDRLRQTLHAAGDQKAATVAVPDLTEVMNRSQTTVAPVDARSRYSSRTRSIGLVLALAAIGLALLLPSRHRQSEREVRSGPGATTGTTATTAPTQPPSTKVESFVTPTAVTAPTSGSTPSAVQPPATVTTAPATTASPTTAPAAAQPRGPWTDPGNRTGLIRCDETLASRSTGADTCNRPLTSNLYRPLQFPYVAVGSPCPVSTDYPTVHVDGRDATFFGAGPLPAGPVGTYGNDSIFKNGLLTYGAPQNSNRYWESYWGLQKVLFAAAPHNETILVRGRQLDGDAALGFGYRISDAAAYDEYHSITNGSTEWQSDPTNIRLRRPGCYGLQIDSAEGTTILVFRADGPTLPEPPPVQQP